MLCPFCSAQMDDEIAGEIELITACCPSDCDMMVKVSARCPDCERVFFAKWIESPYLWALRRHHNFRRLSFTEKYGAHPIQEEEHTGIWEYEDGVLYLLCDEFIVEAQ